MNPTRLLVLLACCATLIACQRGDGSGQIPVIQIDGSSTVYPITEAVAEEFQIGKKGAVRVTVGVSGTGGGFKKFCRAESSISNASRPILEQEIKACAEAGVRYVELPVAYDALTVVVNPANTWLESITVDQLKTMWQPESQGEVMRWSQIDPSWPDREFKLFGAGADSGTFDYFTEAVMGKAKSSRGDFTASEDDNVLVTGVANEVDAIGFFGFAYYTENRDKLRALPIRLTAESAAVGPSMESVGDGTYQPMSRPAFIYVNADHAAARPEIAEFVRYYLAEAEELIKEVGYIPLPDRAYSLALTRFDALETGTVFEGHSEVGVSIETLLQRTPK